MNGRTETTDEQASLADGDVGPDVETGEQAPAESTEDAGIGDCAEPADEIALLQAKADDNWNNYLRAAAELENVRKRSARDVDNARKFALERICGELLAVRDSLEMGLDTVESADVEQLRIGSDATLKLLVTTMERFGVAEVDPLGEPFDPELHEAMTMQPSTEVEPGSVLTVYQKGYVLNGRLLRPARVVVAQEAPGSDEEA